MNIIGLSVAHWCVLVAALLPIAAAGIAKSGKFATRRSEGGYDNHDPRGWLAQQTGWRARANAAQVNSFEQLPFFIGAVAIAGQLGGARGWVDALALAYVLLRVGYIAAYVADRAALRSVLWAAALLVNIAILFVAGW